MGRKKKTTRSFEDITLAEQGKKLMAGRPPEGKTKGSNYDKWMEAFGLSKDDFMAIGDDPNFIMQLKKKHILMTAHSKTAQFMLDYYAATEQKGIRLFDLAAEIRTQMVVREAEQRELDPTYDPLADDAMQKAQARLADILNKISKMKVDVTKLQQEAMAKRSAKNITPQESLMVTDLLEVDDL